MNTVGPDNTGITFMTPKHQLITRWKATAKHTVCCYIQPYRILKQLRPVIASRVITNTTDHHQSYLPSHNTTPIRMKILLKLRDTSGNRGTKMYYQNVS